ncbi:hypothetical protein Q5752_005734 [Cryptotrichosporon argae]
MPNPLGLKAVLVDLNGTLHVGRDALPGAVAAIGRLRAAGVPFIFCSNSTKESDAHLCAKLRDMGLAVAPRELLTSLGACRQLVDAQSLRPYLLMSPEAASAFPPQAPPYDSVILGLHEPSLSYAGLNTAFRILAREPLSTPSSTSSSPSSSSSVPSSFSASSPGLSAHAAPDRKPVLIAPHRSRYQQTPGSPDLPAGLSLGLGPFVAALEAAAGVHATVLGKPTRRFFELALERLGLGVGVGAGGDVGVVGDDVENDLGEGARELGLRRILVRTGKYRPGDEARHAPDAVYDSFAAFVDDLVGGRDLRD